MKKKALLMVLAAAVLVVASVGGTLAWLTAKTDAVTNTFTVGKVTLALDEQGMNPTTRTQSFKLIPGATFAKEPCVTVDDESEACYVFVKVQATPDVNTYTQYNVDTNVWTALSGVDGVFYKKVSDTNNDQIFYILEGNAQYPNGKVTVASGVTDENLGFIGTDDYLKFTAYAIQSANLTPDTAAEAWARLNAQDTL